VFRQLAAPGDDPADLPIAPVRTRPPALRPRAIARPQLLRRLDAVLQTPVTLIAAPAGFGKTTLVASWLASVERRAQNGEQRSTEYADPALRLCSTLCVLRFAWLSLDDGDNDPVRLLRGLITALRHAAPQVGEAALSVLAGGRDAHGPLLSLLCDLELMDRGLVLVLDDVHLLREPGATALLTALVDHLPPTLRLVLAGRADPPLPLARLRARGQLGEIRARDLRFTAVEAGALLNATLGVALESASLERLVQRTEGWAAGLQLAGLALQTQAEPVDLTALSGTHRFVLDYLADEVLDRQPPEIQHFLLYTSLLERMCGALCDEVVRDEDRAEAGDGAEHFIPHPSSLILAQIERANLFLVPLDAEGRWYRYHQLFADLLRHRLQQRHPKLVPVLHRRAAHWFAGQGLVDEAIRHALAGDDQALAAGLIAAEGRARLARGELATLQGWLDALPPGQVTASPQLTILRAWSLVWAYEPAAVSALLPALEGAPPDLHAEVLALRAFVARSRDEVASAVQLSEQALGSAPDNPLLRGFLYAGLGDTAWFAEDAARAIACHGCALECATRSGDLVQLVDAAHSLAQFELLQGRLGAADATYHYATELLTARGSVGQPFGELLALSRAGVLFERYELGLARAAAEQALIQATRCGLSVYAPFAQLELARITALQGDATAARRALVAVQQGLRHMLAHSDGEPPVWAATVELRQLEVLIALGDGPAIVRWVLRHWTSPDPAAPVALILRQLGLTLALVSNLELPELGGRVQAPLPELAEALLGACLTRFRAWGLGAVVLELQTLSAVLHADRGDVRESEMALADALRLAAPEGFVRPFVSRGEPMRRLLTAGLLRWPGEPARQSLIPFVERLLEAFPARNTTAGSTPTSQGSGLAILRPAAHPLLLPEPLSLREREVLPLLAAGLSHRQIAARLTIAPDTARTHIKNIYGKLQARNRVEALAQARAYGLL
jgi:LuxR family maltose regulon positive regulatory protein